jgi:hypothetical protein
MHMRLMFYISDVAENDEIHYIDTRHTLSIKISPFNIIEMWCYSCKRVVRDCLIVRNTRIGINAVYLCRLALIILILILIIISKQSDMSCKRLQKA